MAANLWHRPAAEEEEFEEAAEAMAKLNEAVTKHLTDGAACTGGRDVPDQPCTACATWYNDGHYVWRLRMVVNRRSPSGW